MHGEAIERTQIDGVAYGFAATLELAGDTLTWRARRGLPPIAENIVTTIHEVRLARWVVGRTSWPGLAVAGVAGLTALRAPVAGAVGLAAAAALVGWRLARPWRRLVLELPGTDLVLDVAAGSAAAATELVRRIERAIATGEAPARPPMLP